jgi:hypothetical protein
MIGTSLLVEIVTIHIFLLLYVNWLLVCKLRYCVVFVGGFPYCRLGILLTVLRIEMESVVDTIGNCVYRLYFIVIVWMISLSALIIIVGRHLVELVIVLQ